MADFVRRGQSPPCSFGRLLTWRTKSASWQTKSANWRTQAESFASRHFSGLFLADRPPVDGGSDRIRSDPRRTQADSADFFWVRLSPPESASADALADWLADPIGSAADPPRTKSADYSPLDSLLRTCAKLVASKLFIQRDYYYNSRFTRAQRRWAGTQ